MIIIAAEKQYENKVKKYLEERECWLVKFFANSYTKSGIPDLLVCADGWFLGIELKAPKGKPSALQIYNLRRIDEAGGFAILLYPDQWELFKTFVDALIAKDMQSATHNYSILKGRWLDKCK